MREARAGAAAAGASATRASRLPAHRRVELAGPQCALGVAEGTPGRQGREVGVGQVDARLEVLAERAREVAGAWAWATDRTHKRVAR